MAGIMQGLRSGSWLDRSRLLGYAAILAAFELALLAFWIFGSRGNLDPTGKPLGTDFISFWSASRLALEGTPALAYDPATHAAIQASVVGAADIGYFGFFYPPVFLLLCLPLALLPYGLSLLAWLTVTGTAYAFALARLLPRLAPLALAACFTFPAILLNIGHGQNGFLSAALFGFGIAFLDRRPLLAGALLGCLAYKPQLAVIIPFALAFSGRWPAFFSAAAAAIVLSLASWLVFGMETWMTFLSSLTLAQETLSAGHVEPGKMVSIFAAARLLHAPSWLALLLQLAAALAVLVLLAGSAKRASAPMLGAISVLATFLATPFALDYDLTLLAIPLAVMLRMGSDEGFRPYEKLALFAAFVLPLAARPIAMGLGIPPAPLVIFALFWLCLARLRRPA